MPVLLRVTQVCEYCSYPAFFGSRLAHMGREHGMGAGYLLKKTTRAESEMFWIVLEFFGQV